MIPRTAPHVPPPAARGALRSAEPPAILLEARRAADGVVATARDLSGDHVREVRSEGTRSVGGARAKASALVANALGRAEATRLAAVGDRASAQESLRAAARHLERSLREAEEARRLARADADAVLRRAAEPALRAVDDTMHAVEEVAAQLRRATDDTADQMDAALRRLSALRHHLPRPLPPAVPASAEPVGRPRVLESLVRAFRPVDEDELRAP